MTEVIENTRITRKKTRGRPSIYDPRHLTQVKKFALLGLTDEQIADIYGVTLPTFRSWCKDIEGFFLSLQSGRDEADAEIAASLYHRAKGYSHKAVKIFQPAAINGVLPEPVTVEYIEHYPPDTQAMRIWLYNRRRERKGAVPTPVEWTEMVQHQVSGKDGGPITEVVVNTTNAVDAAEAYRQLMNET